MFVFDEYIVLISEDVFVGIEFRLDVFFILMYYFLKDMCN